VFWKENRDVGSLDSATSELKPCKYNRERESDAFQAGKPEGLNPESEWKCHHFRSSIPKSCLSALFVGSSIVALRKASASDILHRFDDNEDSYLDAPEYQRLSWAKDANLYDLNQDRRLTQIERTVWVAAERARLGINQRTLAGATTWLNRYDLNSNGQLDPDEISEGGWPKEPKEFDNDKNGTITFKEIAAQFALKNEMRASKAAMS
jgi:hypothetical protein